MKIAIKEKVMKKHIIRQTTYLPNRLNPSLIFSIISHLKHILINYIINDKKNQADDTPLGFCLQNFKNQQHCRTQNDTCCGNNEQFSSVFSVIINGKFSTFPRLYPGSSFSGYSVIGL